METPPLFIPLKSEWFDLFASGAKTVEWRLVGHKWNVKTCVPGRPVVLSRGYGRRHRLSGTVDRVSIVSRDKAPRAARELFPGGQTFIAIKISLDRH